MSTVDLHVAAADLAAKTKEAAGLPKLNIDKMSTQWLQVNAYPRQPTPILGILHACYYPDRCSAPSCHGAWWGSYGRG